jgi:hypothetical protein
VTAEAEVFAPIPQPQPQPEPGPLPLPDIPSMILEESIRDAIWMSEATSHRSKQAEIGWSEAGDACPRKLAYALTGTAKISYADPLKAMVGTGGHLIMAQHYQRLDNGSGRYVTEVPLEYRGIPGTADLLDRRRRVVIDWKFKPIAKVKRLIREGVEKLSPGYVVQAHGYGAGLRAAGEDVSSVALAFVPTDDTLAGIHVWSAPLDETVADKAADRLDALRGFGPHQIPPRPSPLCPWCPWYRAGWAGDRATACPGAS